MAARRSRKTTSAVPGLYTIDDVVYDEATHTSKLPTGHSVPHVTAVLSAVGISTNFSQLGEISPRLADQIEYAARLGQAVHKDTHAYDDDDLDINEVHPAVVPFVEAWAEFRYRKRALPITRERRLFHPLLLYTGWMDGLFDVDGELVLIDIKTGDPESAGARWQTAAYAHALTKEHLGDRTVSRRWSVMLDPSRRVPYSIADYTAEDGAWRHIEEFKAFLVTYNLQAVRRSKR